MSLNLNIIGLSSFKFRIHGIKIMIFAVRHTERADRIPKPPPVKIPYDPHLTETGLVQARRTGKKILETIDAHIEPDEIIIYTSPFLRCVQTAA